MKTALCLLAPVVMFVMACSSPAPSSQAPQSGLLTPDLSAGPTSSAWAGVEDAKGGTPVATVNGAAVQLEELKEANAKVEDEAAALETETRAFAKKEKDRVIGW